MRLARGFLYTVAILTVLIIAGFFALRLFSDRLSAIAFVPGTKFEQQQPLPVNAYDNPAMWYSRPGVASDGLARWQPAYAKDSPTPPALPAAAAKTPPFAVFFVHSTSYLEKARWNAPLEDRTSQDRARLFLKGMASPFAQASEIWAPRYRQAAFGAFLTEDPQADQALNLAYRDVDQAFSRFLATVDPRLPIVLVGHSQGSAHVLRLLRERVAGTALAGRIAAVYAVGWPISVQHDLPALGLPACTDAAQAGCVMSWVSFAEPADPGQMLKRFNDSPGFDGKPRKGGPILCTNPITGVMGGSAPASANLGTLLPSKDLSSGELIAASVPAACTPSGILSIGDPPQMGAAVLPGNNYHVYDMLLFWKNLQEDVARRVAIWKQGH